jgi:hypothetical protein
MIVEYRSTSGKAAFRALNGERITLRNLGCPESIIKLVMDGREKRAGIIAQDTPAAPAPMESSVDATAMRERLRAISLF